MAAPKSSKHSPARTCAAGGRSTTAKGSGGNLSAVTRADGERLAIALVDILERDEAVSDAASLEPEYRHGAPQRNVMLEHLVPILAGGSGDALAGFCGVLSGYIATTATGAVPDAEYLAQLVDEEARAERARSDPAFRTFMTSTLS